MLFEILSAILIGIFFGIITGLTPGIHINLVAVLSLSASPFLLKYISPLTLTIFIISMAITHTFLDFIPSVFLGAPDPDTALTVLPAHRLLLEGKGYEAVQLSVIGSLFGTILIIIFVPILILLASKGYSLIQPFIPFILIMASAILILKDKSKFWALISFVMSGTLGLAVLSLQNLKQPLFPLLSGLFGISILLLSIKDNVKLPVQQIIASDIPKKEIRKALSGSFIASSLLGFLPGLGSAQASILGSSIAGKLTTKGFIVLVGAVNTIVMVISFIALYTIDRARSGAIVIISKILGVFTLQHLIIYLAVTLIVAGIATFLSLKIARILANKITKVNYKKLAISIIILIIVLVCILSGFLGLLVLIIATTVGLIPSLKGAGKNHLMGSLIIPVILFFLL